MDPVGELVSKEETFIIVGGEEGNSDKPALGPEEGCDDGFSDGNRVGVLDENKVG